MMVQPVVQVRYRGEIGNAPDMTAKLVMSGTFDPLPSPSTVCGNGTEFSEAIDNLVHQLDAYIRALTDYRDRVLLTTQVYWDAVMQQEEPTESPN